MSINMKAYDTRFQEGLPALVVQHEYVTEIHKISEPKEPDCFSNKSRAGEWFEDEEIGGSLRSDGSVFICFVKSVLEDPIDSSWSDLSDENFYETDFFGVASLESEDDDGFL